MKRKRHLRLGTPSHVFPLSHQLVNYTINLTPYKFLNSLGFFPVFILNFDEK